MLDYQIDWVDSLGSDTIATSTWSVPAGITKDSDTNTTTTTTAWLSGGTANTNYTLTNTITTAGGRTLVKTLDLFVEPETIATPRTFYSLYRTLAKRLRDPNGNIWTADELKECVNGAIQYWDSHGGYAIAITAPLTIVDSQLTYNLPAAITSLRNVVRVLKRSSSTTDLTTADLSTGYAGTPVIEEVWHDVTAFKLTQNGSTVKLLLRTAFATTDVVAVVYKTYHAVLAADTDTTEVDPEFIYTFGRYLAHNLAAGNVSQEDRKFHVEEREAALRDARILLDVALRARTLNPYVQQQSSIPADW